ncbi:response regulator transcription factor [Acidisphaera sp. L21]|jgi:two-component system cell cycle response regulator DivK|uniref:response regulator transcription factor n=1 Tax=Acidisphaera sp. L21 TaxID=1641851 RepID=UPI0020B132BA|nr:response regulator [Acidisphaera sp. L21]
MRNFLACDAMTPCWKSVKLDLAMTKLLLVEDHEELWDFLSRRLRKRGFDVVLAHDGQQALDQVAAESPDLVLLDMNLPVIDGWTVAQTLRAQGNATPLIALTAHAMAGDRARALEAGCDDYHPKPVNFSGLLQQIDDVMLKREEATV